MIRTPQDQTDRTSRVIENQDKTNRRTVLKALGAGASTVVLSTGSSAIDKQRERSATEDIDVDSMLSGVPYDITLTSPGQAIKSTVGPAWWLLTVDKKVLEKYLEQSPVGVEKSENQKQLLSNIRSKYMVEKVRKSEHRLEYEFVDQNIDYLQTEERNQIFELAETIIAGVNPGRDERVGTTGTASVHEAMANDLMSEYIFDDDEKSELMDGVVEPDTWPKKCLNCSSNWIETTPVDVLPSFVADRLRTAIRDISDSASPHQMYLPEELEYTYCLEEIPVVGCVADVGIEISGAAHIECQHHADEARSAWNSETKTEELGRALHFTQDCAVPLHTGAVQAQIGLTLSSIIDDPLASNGWVHTEYEKWIDDNINVFFGVGNDYWEGVSNPHWDGSAKNQIKSISSLTSFASYDVFETIFEAGPNNSGEWGDDVKSQTEGCMYFAGTIDSGLIQDIWE